MRHLKTHLFRAYETTAHCDFLRYTQTLTYLLNSEVTTLWRYTNECVIIIINITYLLTYSLIYGSFTRRHRAVSIVVIIHL